MNKFVVGIYGKCCKVIPYGLCLKDVDVFIWGLSSNVTKVYFRNDGQLIDIMQTNIVFGCRTITLGGNSWQILPI